MLWVWIGIIIVACILEWVTQVQLVSIWAALGGTAALISYLCGANVTIQFMLFFVITALALALTRPFVKKMTKFKKTATNADMSIGKIGRVVNITNEDDGIFQVKLDGCIWSAVTNERKIIPVGSNVEVLDIEGVKLIVTPSDKSVTNGVNS